MATQAFKMKMFTPTTPPAQRKATVNRRLAHEWHPHQQFILEQYIGQKRSLEDVTEALSARGFDVSLAQLKHKLQAWGKSQKIYLKPAERLYLARSLAERENKGKLSTVRKDGVKLQMRKVKRTLRRHQADDTAMSGIESIKSPSGMQIDIRTPSSCASTPRNPAAETPREVDYMDTIPDSEEDDIPMNLGEDEDDSTRFINLDDAILEDASNAFTRMLQTMETDVVPPYIHQESVSGFASETPGPLIGGPSESHLTIVPSPIPDNMDGVHGEKIDDSEPWGPIESLLNQLAQIEKDIALRNQQLEGNLNQPLLKWPGEGEREEEVSNIIEKLAAILVGFSKRPQLKRNEKAWDSIIEQVFARYLSQYGSYLRNFFLQEPNSGVQTNAAFKQTHSIWKNITVIDSMHVMARVLRDRACYDEALEWYVGALAGKEEILGKEDKSTLLTVNEIGTLFFRRNLPDKALELHRRALAGYEKKLGRDHISTLCTVNKIGLVYDEQNQYDEALKWYMRAPLTGYIKALGEDHLRTLGVINNIGVVFDNQGRYEEAMRWYNRCLAGVEKLLGKDHPNTLDTVHNIAWVFQNQKRDKEALKWYKRALAGTEKALGKDHPDTLYSVFGIARVFDKQGRCDEALGWCQRALVGFEKTLGKDNPFTQHVSDTLSEFKSRLASIKDNSA